MHRLNYITMHETQMTVKAVQNPGNGILHPGRKMLRSILTLTFLVLWCGITPLMAQKGSIQGRVFNAKTNEALEFANILVEGTTLGTISDEKGNFSFENVEPGFPKLIVSLIGFHTAVTPEIQVQGNQTAYIDIPVTESAQMLNEVVVRQTLNLKRIESPLSVIQVGVQEIEKGAGINRDVSKLIQTLPGIGLTDPNRNDLIVRGGGPSENVFYLDGVEIPVINHFTTQGSSGGAVGIINPDFVRDISFYTGAFPANRTNALSSVMEIRQKEGSKDHVHGKLSVGASDAAITLDGPVGKKSSFIVSARQSYLQFLFDAIGLPFLPTYTDYQFKWKTDLSNKDQLTIIGLGAIDDMTLNMGITNPSESQSYILAYLPLYQQWNYTLGAVYKHFADNYNDTWVLSRNMLRNASYKYQDNDAGKAKTQDYLSDEAENKFRFERNYIQGDVKVLWGIGTKFSRYTNNTYRQLFQNGQVTDLEYQTKIKLWNYQAFVQISNEFFNERLKMSFGMSTIGNNYNAPMANPLNQLSPRLSASYTLNEMMNVNANIGRYAMQPAYTTLGFRNREGMLVNQTENLKYILSDQAIAGLEILPDKKVRITLEGFYKKYSNYPMSVSEGISLASKGTDYGQVGDEQVLSNGKGRAFGFEFLAKLMDYKHWNLSATYTLFRSEFTDQQQVYRSSSWDTRQLVNLIASVKLNNNWNLSGRWRYSGGAPYTPADEDLSTLRSAWDIRNLAYPDYSQYNTLRLPAAHQLDLRVDKEFYFNKWLLNLYADVQNVYNFKSESAPIYTNRDASGAVQIDPQNSNRYLLRKISVEGGTILPTIGIILKL